LVLKTDLCDEPIDVENRLKLKILKVKICGMKDPGNIRRIAMLSPDYMGFIFYPHSRRYAGDLSAAVIADLPAGIRKVGVFVDLPPDDVLSACRQMGIRTVQLHGTESPEYCRSLKYRGLEVFKVFSMGPDTCFPELGAYIDSCDRFLLDTAGEEFGGTGRKFDWKRLGDYELDKPFFLSGGIGPGDVERILKISHPRLFGVDLNSRFETRPGVKSYEELEKFIMKIRRENVN
jgi:phosphoribosylanthranilate isomerase